MLYLLLFYILFYIYRVRTFILDFYVYVMALYYFLKNQRLINLYGLINVTILFYLESLLLMLTTTIYFIYFRITARERFKYAAEVFWLDREQ